MSRLALVLLVTLAALPARADGPVQCLSTDSVKLINGALATEKTPDVPPDAAVLLSCQADSDCNLVLGPADARTVIPYGHKCDPVQHVCTCQTNDECRLGHYERACLSGPVNHCACVDDWQCPAHHLCNVETGNCYRPVGSVEFHAPAGGVTDATCALRQAVHDVDEGGTLHIPKGLYLLQGPVEVTKSVHLIGDGFFDALRTKWLQPFTPDQIRQLYGAAGGFGGTVLWARSSIGGLIFKHRIWDGQARPSPSAEWVTGGNFMLLGSGIPGSVGLQTGVRDRGAETGGVAQPVNLSNVLVANFDIGFFIFKTEDSLFDDLQAHGVGTGLLLDLAANANVFTNTSVIGFTHAGIDVMAAMENLFKGGIIADAREGGVGVWLRRSLCDKNYRTTLDGFDFQQSGAPGQPNVPLHVEFADGATIANARFSGLSQCIVIDGGAMNVKLVDSLVRQQSSSPDTFFAAVSKPDIQLIDLFDDAGERVTPTTVPHAACPKTRPAASSLPRCQLLEPDACRTNRDCGPQGLCHRADETSPARCLLR